MVSAYQRLLIKSELDEHGISDIIEKPFVPSHFIHKLCVALGRESNAPEESETFTRFKDARVLLCEDYHLNQEVACGMLSQFGVEVTIADNGAQGVDILHGGIKFDLVFMDLHMPVMDGFEATRIIRADPRFDDTPIISLTADAMKEAVEECLGIGMNDHLAKPIEFTSLHKILYKWMPESKRVAGDEVAAPAADPKSEVIARFGGSRERYRKAMIEFAGLLPVVWESFGEAVSDVERAKKYVHKLKGAAGTVGETEIFKRALDFENSIHDGIPNEALYEALVLVCDSVRERIIFESAAADVEPLEAGAVNELQMLLANLKDALLEYNPKTSSEVIKILKKKEWQSTDKQKMSRLIELTEKYEFDTALDVLNDIMGGLK